MDAAKMICLAIFNMRHVWSKNGCVWFFVLFFLNQYLAGEILLITFTVSTCLLDNWSVQNHICCK